MSVNLGATRPALAAILAIAPMALIAQPAEAGTESCIAETYFTTNSRTGGFKGTDETSYQAAGPTTISYTNTDTANQTFSGGGVTKAEAGIIIAKAEQSFNYGYSYSTASTKSWGYNTSIPAGQTGLMAVLHRNDRVQTTKYIDQPNCTTGTSTFSVYIPRDANASADYCIIRDLYPYNYTGWRSLCTGD